MAFASAWLQKGALFPEFVHEAPHPDTGIVVVIPPYNETGITRLLDSLASCHEPGCHSEVIVNVNAPPDACEGILANNRLCIRQIEAWRKKNRGCFFRLYFFDNGQPEFKKWGVGLARKTLMDEALRRFDHIEKPAGVIANLDADCLVAGNYFRSLEEDFLNRPERKACSIYFEHPVSGVEYSGEVYNSIIQYELHLRYYQHALRFTGFPYTYHTVGSSIAVKALPYLLAGGMNRRQAGEDFYFVQKLMPAGGYFNLNSTVVYPSPRQSERVPFGTGMAISKMVNLRHKEYMTYNPQAFKDLKELFALAGKLYMVVESAKGERFDELPASLRAFMDENEWASKIREIRRNTSGIESFRKRFFEWFNMFRIVKFLNHSHVSAYERIPVADASMELIEELGTGSQPMTSLDLLMLFRESDSLV